MHDSQIQWYLEEGKWEVQITLNSVRHIWYCGAKCYSILLNLLHSDVIDYKTNGSFFFLQYGHHGESYLVVFSKLELLLPTELDWVKFLHTLFVNLVVSATDFKYSPLQLWVASVYSFLKRLGNCPCLWAIQKYAFHASPDKLDLLLTYQFLISRSSLAWCCLVHAT